MATIFPGMDPYLERASFWPGVHNALIVYLRDLMQPLLQPRYVAAIEERVFIEARQGEVIPDISIRKRDGSREEGAIAVAELDEPVVVELAQMEIHESYINILDLNSGQAIVTVIEVLSPSNKAGGEGRASYLKKQGEVRQSTAHLVEIDLLRDGTHTLAVPEEVARNQGDYDYLVCVNRAVRLRSIYDLYPLSLRQRLPRIRVPLAEGDDDVRLDLQAALSQVYEAGRYRDRIDYDAPCQPPLNEADQKWADELIADAKHIK